MARRPSIVACWFRLRSLHVGSSCGCLVQFWLVHYSCFSPLANFIETLGYFLKWSRSLVIMDQLPSYFAVYQLCVLAAVCLMLFLFQQHRTALLIVTVVLTISVVSLFVVFASIHTAHEPWGEIGDLIKFLCVLPLGLGPIVVFLRMPRNLRQLNSNWFSWYVNVAVVVNIAMVAALPTSGTYRGVSSRFACASLVVWLVFEMLEIGWFRCVVVPDLAYTKGPPAQTPALAKTALLQTTKPVAFQTWFLFTASPADWVLCHAAYRLVLVTLPTLDTFRYLLLEPLSIYLAMWLSSKCAADHNASPTVCDAGEKKSFGLVHWSYFFGMADTLVVATMGTVSHLADHVMPPDSRPLKMSVLPAAEAGGAGDMAGVVVHVLVTCYAVRSTWSRRSSLLKLF